MLREAMSAKQQDVFRNQPWRFLIRAKVYREVDLKQSERTHINDQRNA